MSEQQLPQRLNLAIAAGIILFHLYLLVMLPVFLLPLSPLWALTLLPMLWLPVTHWGLIHEAIHKHFHPNAKINEYGGRLLSVLMGVSFHVLRFGHLMHHKLNRNWETELVRQNGWKANLKHYGTLLGGLYFAEIFSGLMLTLLSRKMFLGLAAKGSITGRPEILEAGERFFFIKKNAGAVRQDCIAIALIYCGAFMLYKNSYPVLLAFLIARALIVSFMDNIYHYGTAADNSEAGKNLALPRAMEMLLLNSNYHETHHRNPQIAWVYLPKTHADSGKPFDGRFWAHGFKQFQGPIVR